MPSFMEREYGPVGTVWFNGYWRETFTVLSYQNSMITVQWHGDGKYSNPTPARVGTHCTSRGSRDRLVHTP
jgi:hypothetical protein